MSSSTALWVKICGLTTPAAVDAALEAHVDAIGFVFAPSVRRVDPARAVELSEVVRGRVPRVAVFKRPTAAEVAEVIRVFRPDIVQLDVESIAAASLPNGLAVLPVLRAGSTFPEPLPLRALFEGPASGTGKTTDWQQARELAERTELILAGGLTPDNVGAAVRQVRPFGIDVSSGVESEPGRKSPELIARFVAAARASAQESSR